MNDHTKTRTIIHMDLDSFYCSVEMLLNPELADVPFVVGGRADKRGVVASASYAARKFGIRSAMPSARAVRLCPQLVILPWSRGQYSKYSRQVMAILHDVTPLVEQISIDEAFMDVSDVVRRAASPEAFTRDLQQRIKDETQLGASFGLATNKLVAKVASDMRKPYGIMIVPPGHEAAFLAPLPVRELWGVGPKTAEQLGYMGIKTIGDIAAADPRVLARHFGKHGPDMVRKAQGIDDRPVVTEREAKSISQEITFDEDVSDEKTLVREILRQSESVGRSLRRSEHHAATIKLKLRWSDFTTFTRQTTLAVPTDLDEVIFETAVALLYENWKQRRPVRLIGVGVSNFGPPLVQLSLFDDAPASPQPDERRQRLAQVVDNLRGRFGKDVITRAALLDDDEGELY